MISPASPSSDLSLAGTGAVRGTAAPLLAGALAAACFVSMDTAIKLMSARYGAVQLSFFRFAGGSVYAVALWLWFRTALPAGCAWRLHLLHSGFLLLSLEAAHASAENRRPHQGGMPCKATRKSSNS